MKTPIAQRIYCVEPGMESRIPCSTKEIHAPGHESRLDRQFGKKFGDTAYAREELCAELGSAFLCARLDIPATLRSASYIDNWLEFLKEDNRAIFNAANYAGQASDWLWKTAFPEPEQQEHKEAAE